MILKNKASFIRGANPEVFKYQFSKADQFGLLTLKMTFYEGTIVFAGFKNDDSTTPFDLTTQLILDGMKVTVKTDYASELKFE